ncbi:protein-tyrosine phosphatase-like protein [Amylostereum chailletii]|nr:protein-tyrosine phosphatase-like protein [Amylostereum chailletii]
MVADTSRNIDAVLDDQLYIGNLAAAKSPHLHSELGITHIVSVCPDIPCQGPNHLVIPVQDSEYSDLVFGMSQACRFIEAALADGGRVLVHCVMGISRSAAVITAYLMKTRRVTVKQAIAALKKRRPKILPNYGFIKQLHVLTACSFDPSPACPAYRTWKRRQRQDVTSFLNAISDTTAIIPEMLYLSRRVDQSYYLVQHSHSKLSDFPSEAEQASSLVDYMGISHCLSLSPADVKSAALSFDHRHINIPHEIDSGLLLHLPDACSYIHNAILIGGRVLVHCSTESIAAVTVCAYLMWSRNWSYRQAYKLLQDALPLFNRTVNFTQHLEVFAACNHNPTAEHPVLRAWLSEDSLTPGLPTAAAVASVATVAASVPASVHLPPPLRHVANTEKDRAGPRTIRPRKPVSVSIVGQS